jgi:hypothetical protein
MKKFTSPTNPSDLPEHDVENEVVYPKMADVFGDDDDDDEHS